jgi:hypothetical protein
VADGGKGCTKVLFVELRIKAANCEGRGVKHTQPSVQFDSPNKYVI